MIRSFKTVLLVAVMLAVVSSAMAATVVQTKNFAGTPNFSQNLVFNKFDTSLGTLTSVQVAYYLTSVGGQLILDNDGWDPASGTYEFGATGSISSVDVALLNSSFQPVVAAVSALNTGSFYLAGDPDQPLQPNGDFNPAGPDGAQFLGGTVNASGSGTVASMFYGGYLGPGTFNISTSVVQWINYGSIGGIEYAVTPVSANGYVQVVYNYNAIPEPASMAGLLTGLAGLGLYIRRRR